MHLKIFKRFVLFQHMKLCHTLEQLQAVGIGEDLVNEYTPSLSSPAHMMQRQNRQARRSGTIKAYTCKQCGFNSATKEEKWAHTKIHIPDEKQLKCNKCQFVTEHRHHLTYHSRSHANFKPFSCSRCEYTSVTISMLNSHEKFVFFLDTKKWSRLLRSHNAVYPYLCLDCGYRTKYCHSLKTHLSRYNHRCAPQVQHNKV